MVTGIDVDDPPQEPVLHGLKDAQVTLRSVTTLPRLENSRTGT